jgi:hypothetical protein
MIRFINLLLLTILFFAHNAWVLDQPKREEWLAKLSEEICYGLKHLDVQENEIAYLFKWDSCDRSAIFEDNIQNILQDLQQRSENSGYYAFIYWAIMAKQENPVESAKAMKKLESFLTIFPQHCPDRFER